MSAERVGVGAARAAAERVMLLGQPVPYETVWELLAALSQADTENARLRADRDHWQDAYCEARLEARQRDA